MSIFIVASGGSGLGSNTWWLDRVLCYGQTFNLTHGRQMPPPNTNPIRSMPRLQGRAADRIRTKHVGSEGFAKTTVYQKRRYAVTTASQAKQIARYYLADAEIDDTLLDFGLPEVDDRYHIWRVPLVNGPESERIGEIVIDARTSLVQQDRSTDLRLLNIRSNRPATKKTAKDSKRRGSPIARSELRNTILLGDSEDTLADLPAESVDLVFTSPPYFNARPDYTEYAAYEDYLAKIGRIVNQCYRLLSEGRFFVINIAPVLLRRAHRNQSSQRIAVPFDLHSVIIREKFQFIDDIIWEKPSGAGWATGRGRRFAADRHPLQYKAVPVTEYVLVYRKQTDRLIDWNIRNHPDQKAVLDSRIDDDYERTNVWRIPPTSSKEHPAIFPKELADRVIKYYSFKGDVVLDPFAGIGTVGESCVANGRRFVLAEMAPTYMEIIRRNAIRWLGKDADHVHCVNAAALSSDRLI